MFERFDEIDGNRIIIAAIDCDEPRCKKCDK